MELANRVALVTGGKRIGSVVAHRTGAEGRRHRSLLQPFAPGGRTDSRCDSRSWPARIREAGQSDEARPSAKAFVNESVAALGRLDVLVNMASIYVSKPFSELTVDEYDENVAVDMRSAFICSRAAWPHMKRNGGGHIVNFSDWLSRSGRPRYTGYLPVLRREDRCDRT